MPELPEMEAWRRALDDPVSAFPIVKAGPGAHRDAEDVRPAAVRARGAAAGRCERRAKRLLFPTADGELVVLVHLMTAGRLKYLKAGRGRPEETGVPARLRRRCAARTDRGRGEEASGCLVAHSGGSGAGACPPRARSARNRRGAAGGDLCVRIEAAALDAPRPARDRGNRARLGERDPASREALAV